jgi:hypothetical protein
MQPFGEGDSPSPIRILNDALIELSSFKFACAPDPGLELPISIPSTAIPTAIKSVNTIHLFMNSDWAHYSYS